MERIREKTQPYKQVVGGIILVCTAALVLRALFLFMPRLSAGYQYLTLIGLGIAATTLYVLIARHIAGEVSRRANRTDGHSPAWSSTVVRSIVLGIGTATFFYFSMQAFGRVAAVVLSIVVLVKDRPVSGRSALLVFAGLAVLLAAIWILFVK